MRVEKKVYRWIALLLLCAGVGPAGWMQAADGQTVTVEAMLIHASDRPAALDARMDRVEYRLRRIFQFEHYGLLNIIQSAMTLPSQARLDIGHGYVLNIDASQRDGRVRAQVEWYQGSTRLLSTSVQQRRNVPAILGGPPHDGGTLILVLEFR